jgi:hypothetical protein
MSRYDTLLGIILEKVKYVEKVSRYLKTILDENCWLCGLLSEQQISADLKM